MRNLAMVVMRRESFVVKTLPERCGQDIVAAKISYGRLLMQTEVPSLRHLTAESSQVFCFLVLFTVLAFLVIQIKEYEYPCVLVEKFSDGNGKGIYPYHEDTQMCCLFQLCCFIPGKRRKDIQNDCLTMVEGLDDNLLHENILVDLKKECQCEGKIVGDGKLGRMIQLEGDRQSQVKGFLHRQGLTKA